MNKADSGCRHFESRRRPRPRQSVGSEKPLQPCGFADTPVHFQTPKGRNRGISRLRESSWSISRSPPRVSPPPSRSETGRRSRRIGSRPTPTAGPRAAAPVPRRDAPCRPHDWRSTARRPGPTRTAPTSRSGCGRCRTGRPPGRSTRATRRRVGQLGAELARWPGTLAVHNVTFDGPVAVRTLGLAARRAERAGLVDTMILARLCHPDERRVGLKEIARLELGADALAAEERLKLAFKHLAGRADAKWRDVDPAHPAYWQYAAVDAALTARLHDRFRPQVDDELLAREMRVALICLRAGLRGWAGRPRRRRQARARPRRRTGAARAAAAPGRDHERHDRGRARADRGGAPPRGAPPARAPASTGKRSSRSP